MAEVTLDSASNGLMCTRMNNARTRSAVQSGLANPAWGDKATDRLGYDPASPQRVRRASGAGRTITKRYLQPNDQQGYEDGYEFPSAVVGFTTAFDPASPQGLRRAGLASNKLYERHLHAESRSHLYPAHDSLDRLREYRRGTLLEAPDWSVSVGSAITLPGTDSGRTYDLDGLGNWRRTGHVAAGEAGPTTEVRRHNLLNQLTRFGATDVTYDHGDNAALAETEGDGDIARRGNGNIATDGTRRYVYDAFNRLTEVYKKDSAIPPDPDPHFTVLIATYTYDALGRRVR
jgi:hypothetical protein